MSRDRKYPVFSVVNLALMITTWIMIAGTIYLVWNLQNL